MRLLVTSFILLLSVASVFAQHDSTGLYRTASDFKARRLSNAMDCNGKNKVKFKGRSHIIVSNGKKTDKLNKEDFYGGKLCGNKFYRFYDGADFQILNTSRIILYAKPQGSGTGRSAVTENLFYFSIDLESLIIPLTIENLKIAFSQNVKFIDLLNFRFRTDDELSEFDSQIKRYKIVRVYEESIQ